MSTKANWTARARPLPENWLPRIFISGFMATVIMTMTFFVGHLFAIFAGDSGIFGGALTRWFNALTHNQVTDLAGNALYLAIALHFAAGIVWAIIYATVAEPRLQGAGWRRGLFFALVPWALSLVVFLPIVGGGIFGLATGAGPLPALGNLILHLAYGISLGGIYGPAGESARLVGGTDERTERTTERATAAGFALGTAVGALVGTLIVAVPRTFQMDEVLGIPPWAFVVGSAIIGGTWGGLVGSMTGLTGAARPR